MAFLVRRVSSEWWEQTTGFGDFEVCGDRFTAKKHHDLRTRDNTLSFWRADNANKDDGLADVALAIGSGFAEPDGIDLVWFEETTLTTKSSVDLADTPGQTFVSDLENRHVDARALDSGKLHEIATVIAKAIRSDDSVLKFTRKEILTLIARAVDGKRVRLENLKQKMKESVASELEEIQSTD